MFEWLQGLSGGAAAFVGSLTGSAIGLVALLLGALFNAYLNRRRDDALRNADARSVAAALRAELITIEEMLLANEIPASRSLSRSRTISNAASLAKLW